MKDIILLGNHLSNENSYETIRIKEEFENKKCKIKYLNSNNLRICNFENNKLSVLDKQSKSFISKPDLIYSLPGGHDVNLICKHFFYSNFSILNNPLAKQIADNKIDTNQLLVNANLPIPDTIIIKPPFFGPSLDNEIDLIHEMLGFPVIIKTHFGLHGIGVHLCNSHHDLKSFLQICDKISLPNTYFIAQKYIGKYKGSDIRVWIIGGEVIGSMLRHNTTGDFRANIAQGASAKKIELDNSLKDMAIKASKIIGLDFAGIDILIDTDCYKICEVNSSPEFKTFEPTTGVNVAEKIVDYCLNYINM
jgi:RimK family alpha-L-glutamate ligase